VSQLSTALVAIAIVGAAASAGCRVVSNERDWVRDGEDWPLKTGPYLVLGKGGVAHVAMKTRSSERVVVEWWPTTEGQEVAESLEPLHEDGDGTGIGRDPIEPREEPPEATSVRRVEAEPESDLMVARLEGLPADRPIAYRVRVGKKTTATFRFRTGVPAGEPFRFVVYGDTRSRAGVHAAVVDAAAREDVSFVVHTGDMVQRGGVKEQWDLFFQIERPLLVDTPIFPSIGNHDLSGPGFYERYFLLERTARGRRYYSYDYGNLRLIALDGGIEGRSGSLQYAFADRALADAAARGMMTMLFLHWPPYSSGTHGSQLDVREPIEELVKRYGVELVVTGHDHMYERTVPIEGATYIVSGSAGAPTRTIDPEWFTAHARTEPHYVLVDVEPDARTMTVRAVNLDGNVFDSAVLVENKPGAEPVDGEVAER
jgi:predicted phosphodiesterase